MEDIRQYLLSVAAAALVCSIIKTLTDGKGTLSSVVKRVCGIFLAITVFSPLVTIDFSDITLLPDTCLHEAEDAVASGTAMADAELQGIIIERTEAYILDKAAELHLQITVDVTLSPQAPYAPCGVTLSGTASPYAKQTLQEYIANQLGISKEAQQWM